MWVSSRLLTHLRFYDRAVRLNIQDKHLRDVWDHQSGLSYLTLGASIISTTSVQAYDPSENLLDYAQTKSAQIAFTKSLAKQLA
jgi:NAD(P)-dependent dehydrogenase (short-subunit alcohol dehydrogenase family)